MICDHSKRKNILLLTDCLGSITGGAEKQIFELAKRLPKNRYNVFIASMEAQGETSEKLIQSIDCHLKIFKIKRIYGFSGLIQGFKFYSFLKKENIQAVMTYHFASDIWGSFWSHLARIPLIISNRRDMGFWRNNTHILAYRLINPWVQRIVTVTDSIKQMVLDKENVNEQRIQVIYNGVDLAPTPKLSTEIQRHKLNLTPEDLVVIHVANLRPVKGHRFLIEAFAEVIKQEPKAKLLLIGKDELNNELQDLAAKYNLNNPILFLGQRNDVKEILPIADICILPSLSEGMSNAILEYMSFGKPVIATKVGGNPELIKHGANGLLVEKENSTQLKEALLTLLRDPIQRQRMGDLNLKLIKENFTMDVMVKKYEQLLQPKVLHIVSSGGFFGAEQMMLTLAKFNDGISQIVGALNNKHNPHLEIIEEAHAQQINTVIFESQGRFDLNTINQTINYIKNNAIDIIHTHNYKANLIGYLARRKTHTKWIVTVHGWVGSDTKLKWYEQLDKKIIKKADHIICVAENNYQGFLNDNFDKTKLSVIPNGINLNKFAKNVIDLSFKESLGIPRDDLVISIVGRLSPEKGHEVLLQALVQIKEMSSNFKCLVVGDGELRKSLEKLTTDLGIKQHVIFTGIRKDMINIYNISDILVNASYSEALPMTLLEAMACKLPIIATDVGAVGNLIENGLSGILIKSGDSKDLAKSIIHLIQDSYLRNNLAEKAYQKVQSKFSDLHMFQQYKQVYEEILNKS